MAIKLGTTNVSPKGISKAYLGSDLVFQSQNYAPATTTALYHFDGNLTNETGQSAATGTYTQETGKFNLATRCNGRYLIPQVSAETLKTGDFTFEFWIKRRNSTNNLVFCVDRGNAAVTFSSGNVINNGFVPTTGYAQSGTTTVIYRPSTFNIQEWHHIAVVFHSGTIYCFLDGKLSSTSTVRNLNTIDVITGLNVDWQWSDFNIDEYLACTEAKYLSDFTPSTKPYVLRS